MQTHVQNGFETVKSRYLFARALCVKSLWSFSIYTAIEASSCISLLDACLDDHGLCLPSSLCHIRYSWYYHPYHQLKSTRSAETSSLFQRTIVRTSFYTRAHLPQKTEPSRDALKPGSSPSHRLHHQSHQKSSPQRALRHLAHSTLPI